MLGHESTQRKLSQDKPSRVTLIYELQLNGAKEEKELPFVVGVLADLSGRPEEPLPRLKDRMFVEIHRDNFNKVLGGCRPRLSFGVKNRVQEDDSTLNIELKFTSLDDFEPEQVVKQIKPLRELLEIRKRLSDLAIKVGNDDRLEQALQGIVHNTDQLKQLGVETGRVQPPQQEV